MNCCERIFLLLPGGACPTFHRKSAAFFAATEKASFLGQKEDYRKLL